MTNTLCPNCLQESARTFYTASPVPVHSVMLVPTRQDAVEFPSGSIALAFCSTCGFISNTAFDESKMDYSPRCEETQGFSATFRSFHRRLAEDLIERCDLRGKRVLEIGCGKGEFIAMLCALGGNDGTGFDPAFVPERRPQQGGDRVEFIQDFYCERYSEIRADFIACKMTLEHIPDTLHFIQTVRRAVGDNQETTVFFQVPDMSRVLRDYAFWDVYHEHCSYFTAKALRNLFQLAGFAIESVWTGYDGQYLMITARPGDAIAPIHALIPPSASEARQVTDFAAEVQRRISIWRQTIRHLEQQGRRAVIWGSGSKGVSFLSALRPESESNIEYAVDINPFRKGYFMPGTGQEIVDPHFLSAYRPDLVIAMNSIYIPEIETELRHFGISAGVLPIELVETTV